uniref:C-type lectin domain-containing protein n=1 Tax=Scleropages formosus TaxID=113540 RepID=A0A8C9SEK0_SCLFO
ACLSPVLQMLSLAAQRFPLTLPAIAGPTLRCDPVPEMRCPSTDWHEYGDFCYKPFTDLKTWHAARSECRKLEADLVSILSIAEQSWMDSYLYLATGDVWTGLNDLEFQGFFTWSDQHEVQFTYWAPGEPNNHDGFKEDCVEMLQQTGRWNDVPCTEINEYICKKPKDHYPVPSEKNM